MSLCLPTDKSSYHRVSHEVNLELHISSWCKVIHSNRPHFWSASCCRWRLSGLSASYSITCHPYHRSHRFSLPLSVFHSHKYMHTKKVLEHHRCVFNRVIANDKPEKMSALIHSNYSPMQSSSGQQ
ncbi:unnamed protein product [Heterobilharzia americana]|nr:unnamed protein product [Heterobilharzia americana]